MTTAASPTYFNLMQYRNIASVISGLLLLLSIGSMVFRGMEFGLDFTGGTLIEVKYQQAPDLPKIREMLNEAGYTRLVVQSFGADTDVLIRLAESFNDQSVEMILTALRAGDHSVELVRAEFVGGQVGEELREQGGMGLLLALGAILIYVALRFQFKFAVGAVVSLVHDVIITLGFFSWFGWDLDLTVLAALLAVIGYSLNDTIIVFDRVRENFRRTRIDDPIEVINDSWNQMLSRTMITSGTTLIVLFSLLIFGGEAIRGFSIALIIGIMVGTYSSIYVAANVALWLGLSREDLLLPVKEVVEGEELP